MIELRVDPEFRDKIPPLTEAEYDQLRENILEDGEVYEPIVVWNGVIVDGHNRWKIICENRTLLDGKYKIKEMDFPDKWAAFEWMYKKQLGRRNISTEQKDILLAKMYEAISMGRGGDRKSKPQNEVLIRKGNTAEIVAKEANVGRATVERAVQFSKGIDALSNVSKEASDKVLKGKTGINKKTVMEIPKMEPEQKKELAEAIVQGTIKEYQKKSTNPNGWSKKAREDRKQTEKVVDELFDTSREITLSVERFLVDIRENGKTYVKLLSNSINRYKEVVTNDNKQDVIQEIEKIITGIKELEEAL